MVLKNISWLFLEKMILMVVLFSTNILIMRVLGPANFGELAFYQLVISVMMALLDFGFRRVYLSQSSLRVSLQILPFILKYKLVLSSLTAFIVLFLVLTKLVDDTFLLLLILIFFSPLEVYSYFYESKLNNKRLVKIRVAVLLLVSLARVAICLNDVNQIFWLVLTYVVHMPVSNFISYLFFRVEKDTEIKSQARGGRLSKILLSIRYRAMFFWFSFVIVQLHLRADQLSIKFLIDYEMLGYYVAAYKFIEQLVSFASMLGNVFLPHVSKMPKLKRDEYLIKIYKFGFLISVPMAITLYLLAGFIVNTFLGDGYEKSIEVLEVLAYSIPVLFLSNLSGLFYSINKLERLAVIRNSAGCIVCFLVCFLTIPHLGVLGAALAVFGSYFTVAFLVELFVVKCRGNMYLKYLALKEILCFPRKFIYSICGRVQ